MNQAVGYRGGGSQAGQKLPDPRVLVDQIMGDLSIPPGTPQPAIDQIRAEVTDAVEYIQALFKDEIAKAFAWPFYAAAIAAFLGVIPAALTGRRLGEHEGHQQMARAERAAAGRRGLMSTRAPS